MHIPNVNSRESTKDKIREVEHIIEELGDWEDTDAETGFQLVRTNSGQLLPIADLVDDDPAKRDKVTAALKNSAHKNDRDWVNIIAQNRQVFHKIGVTGGDVAARIANAKKDPTFLAPQRR